MTITELNFLFIGRCLGRFVEEKPILGKLLHQSVDIDWHTKVYNYNLDEYLVEEAFLDHENFKWQKAYYIVKKSTFNWDIEKEGNQTHVLEEEKEVKTLILK